MSRKDGLDQELHGSFLLRIFQRLLLGWVLPIELAVEEQDIDTGFAQESQIRSRGRLRDELIDLFQSNATSLRNAGCLSFRRGRTEVGVETTRR